MLEPVYITGDNMITALGFDSAANFESIKNGKSGIHKVIVEGADHLSVPLSLVDTGKLTLQFSDLEDVRYYTRLEQLMILSVSGALKQNGTSLADPRTLLVISTTKGNIDMLNPELYPHIDRKRLYLGAMGKAIGEFFNYHNHPIIISNACISGVEAIVTAARLIRRGYYNQAVVCGGDIIDGFTVSGFQSFKALSEEVCKPFDKDRTGLNLGEGIGTVVLSKTPTKGTVQVLGGAVSNDANHISGPSRDGSGLRLAINKALAESTVEAKDVDLISAHGTATPYNDEMEAIAFDSCGLSQAAVNSLKAYFGHTLGGAGLIESIMTSHMLRQQKVVQSAGYEHHGVSRPIQVATATQALDMKYALKTASGFGGCNAALILKRP